MPAYVTYLAYPAIALLSILFGYWLATLRAKRMETELALAKDAQVRFSDELTQTTARLESLQKWKNELDVKIGRLETEKHSLESDRLRLQDETQSLREKLQAVTATEQTALQQQTQLRTALSSCEHQVELIQNQLKDKDTLLTDSNKNFTELKAENGRLLTAMKANEQHAQEKLKLLEDSRSALKKEFENLANEILERKGQAFKQLNQESMSNILNPIHAELKGFRSKVEDIHSKETAQRAALKNELENLQKHNKAITDQADKLTNALKGQKKVQGNWGELMLENVLDNSGLRLGKDYKREVNFNTEEGKLRPDAIVYLPQDKHLVIDAKTSLNAYTRFVNAEQEEERQQALREHAAAVRDRIAELADKTYFKLPGLNSPEVVIMFIPVESAYVEALKADESLFQRAIEQNVLVATPTTLLTSLNIVRQLWQFEEQNKHTAELANRAERFYTKLNSFLTSMQGVGKQLDKAREGYDKALSQLYTGRGNLIKQASEFKELGVSVQKELPTELVEKAQLELSGPETKPRLVE